MADRGRPTIFSEELAEEICDYLSEGYSMRQIISRDDKPALTTIYRWLRENESFRQQYAQAREQQAHTIADRAVGMALSDVLSDPSASKVILDAIKWTAARMAPRVYGDKAELNVGGQTDNPVATVIRWER